MLRRAARSAWKWRSSSSSIVLRSTPPGALLERHGNAHTSCWQELQRRSYGRANVWIDQETADERNGVKKAQKRKEAREKARYEAARNGWKEDAREEVEDDARNEERRPRGRTKPFVNIKKARNIPNNTDNGRTRLRTWNDGTPRPAGREGRIRMLDSGKLIGSHRIATVNKYGMPRRIPRKIRLGNLEKRRAAKRLRLELEANPELKEKMEKLANRGPIDTGAARRLREKQADIDRMNKYERMRHAEEKYAGEHFASPLKSDQKKVLTLFGEIDVTAAKEYKEMKARRREALGAPEKLLQIEAVPSAQMTQEGTVQVRKEVKREASVLTRLRERALKLYRSGEMKVKMLPANTNSVDTTTRAGAVVNKEASAQLQIESGLKMVQDRPLKQVKAKMLTANSTSEDTATRAATTDNKIEAGTSAEMKKEAIAQVIQEASLLTRIHDRALKLHKDDDVKATANVNEDTATRTAGTSSKTEAGSQVKKEAKVQEKQAERRDGPLKLHKDDETKGTVLAAKTTTQDTATSAAGTDSETGQAEAFYSGGSSRKVEVTLMTGEEATSEDDEDWVWALDSTRRMDTTDDGLKLSRVLGTNALLGFPRLVKAKKTRSRTKKAQEEDWEKDLVFNVQSEPDGDNQSRPTLFDPAQRSLALEREIIAKTLEEYQKILEAEAVNPRRKPYIMRVLKIDKDDITFKRYETPEERKASGVKPPSELSANARFRQIQPSRELMNYINSQLLGRRRLDEWRKAGYNVKLRAPLDNVPFHKGEEKHRIHQSVFRNKHIFVAGAKVASSIPMAELPEIAFAGRSNVGKSKLINALTRTYGRARTSPIPGKTTSLNFYVVSEKLCLVDTPGYTFMYGNKMETILKLRQLTKDYITIRDELKRVCLLIDAQWGIRLKDQEFIDFLETVHRKYQIVLTKTDKVAPLDLGRRVTQIEEMLKDCKHVVAPVLMVSALSGAGIGRLRMSLASLL